MFTQAEVRFLSREHAAAGLKEFPVIDPTSLKTNKEQSLRCIQGVLERRAKALGKTFTDFQTEQNPTTDLDTRIASSTLF